MKIGIVDADLLGRTNQRFPNLALMKISAFYKEQNCEVKLVESYDRISKENRLFTIEEYDKIFLSKAFTDTLVPEHILQLDNLEYGGTGFFFDKAPPLPDEIEHHMPDYHLYDDWVKKQISAGRKRNSFSNYLDYSIGFTTRGCHRKCSFCVNRNYNRVHQHSPVSEFLDKNRPYICLLDDNIFAYKEWKNIFMELQTVKKQYKFNQGMDIRLLTEDKAKMLDIARYKDKRTFAFDNIADKDNIEKKLTILREATSKDIKFYVLTAFDRADKYNDDFWVQDIVDLFERIKILMEYFCLPYIMRFNKWKESPNAKLYSAIMNWCNSGKYIAKISFKDYLTVKNIKLKIDEKVMEIVKLYWNMRMYDIAKYKIYKEKSRQIIIPAKNEETKYISEQFEFE